MNKKEVERLAELYFNNTVNLLGESKYHNCTPYLVVEYSPQSEGIDMNGMVNMYRKKMKLFFTQET
jgi:hypothetical protein